MITAILGLPAIGFCLVACASQWLSFTEGLMVKGMQEVKEAFVRALTRHKTRVCIMVLVRQYRRPYGPARSVRLRRLDCA